MRTTKTQTCLYIYEQLLTVGYVEIDTIYTKFDLQSKTIMRYINEIRAYLSNFYKNQEIKYNRSKRQYYLLAYHKCAV